MAMTSKSVDILFCHASGLCAKVWEPVIKHLVVQSPTPRLPHHISSITPHTLDFLFHGKQTRTESTDRGFSEEIVNWPNWGPQQILENKESRRDSKDNLKLGVGHSLGAICLLLAEQRSPGTFDGLILFEPPILHQSFRNVPNMKNPFYANTINRKRQWSSMEDAKEYFRKRPFFQSWDQESLARYIEGGIRENEQTGAVSLCCDPKEEAKIYTVVVPFETFTDDFPPKLPVHFVSGALSEEFFTTKWYSTFHQFPNVSHSEIENTGHFMVAENPRATADVILQHINLWCK